jgi:glycosyltransferase involved in cell wall biosynthesis
MAFDKTILQVIPAMDAGGAERTTLEMARAIIAAGGRAIVATSGGRMIGALEAAGAQVSILPVHGKSPLTIAANGSLLADLIRERGADIIHARSRAPAWSALMAARRTGVPLVTTWHGAYRGTSPWKRFYNSAMARGDLVIANSNFTAETIRASHDPGDRLIVIHRGADTDEFNLRLISDDRRAAVLEKWGLRSGEGPVLLLPARLTDWKGHGVALDALSRLKKAGAAGAGTDLRLIFAGDAQGRDGYAASLARGVEDLGLGRMIRLVGHCDDMPAAYAAADIVLSPSTRPEAFGRVAAEAGAMGRVVIAADHGGARETVVDGETGFLVPPGSADALANAVVRAIGLGPEGRAAMGAKAAARIAAKFSTAAMTAATIAAYASLLDRRTVQA